MICICIYDLYNVSYILYCLKLTCSILLLLINRRNIISELEEKKIRSQCDVLVIENNYNKINIKINIIFVIQFVICRINEIKTNIHVLVDCNYIRDCLYLTMSYKRN